MTTYVMKHISFHLWPSKKKMADTIEMQANRIAELEKRLKHSEATVDWQRGHSSRLANALNKKAFELVKLQGEYS